jgi:hypothetical protein
MIKEKIPELQKLSAADKFALAVELWDEFSSNPDEITHGPQITAGIRF